MSDRKAELERKKAKLQAMREEKKRKEEDRKRREVEDGASPAATAPGGSPRPADLRSETEKMLQDLGIPATAAAGTAAPPAAAVPAAARQGEAPVAATTPTQSAQTKSKKISLGISKVTQTNIAPRENVSYSKETQTPAEQLDREDDDNDSLVTVDTPPLSVSHKLPPLETHVKAQQEEGILIKEEEKPVPVRELSDEERRQLMNSEDFMRFFDRSSRIMERALTDNVDIFTDYSGNDAEDLESGLAEGDKLKVNRQFYDERWSRHRTVTCMDWSTQYPELLVASYNNNDDAPHEPDGVALIWNLKYKKDTPEYVFHYQSSVMSTCFAKFQPNLIIGGTYSGQIVLWDNRSNKRTPVQRTPLSAAGHTHPVYCVNVVGTQNAHNLISISNDGKICSWSLEMLSQPQDSMELQHKQTKAVAVTSFSFLSGDVNNFVVGSEEGAVYTACRHGSKAGIGDMFEAHQGPVTGIDCNTAPGQVDFSHYFLSSSFDWTVKLWNIKDNRPLYSFEDYSDYVLDVRWSPIHPALFATVDCSGRLDLWNLNNDTEVAVSSVVVDGQQALNQCRWHQSGKDIAAGDDMGRIHVYDVGEPVAMPRKDEWSRLVHTLTELKNQQSEDDEPGSMTGGGGGPTLRY